MKNTLLSLIILFFVFLKAEAQLIVPIDKVDESTQNYERLPANTYFKDVNGILDNFTGIWQGTYKNKSYYFSITKKIGFPNERKPETLYDGLIIRFRITDNNTGQVLYDKFKLPEKSHLTVSRYREVTKDKYSMLYYGDEREKINCGDIGRIYLNLFENKEKLKVHVKPKYMEFLLIEDEEHPCPQGRVLPPFPDKKEDALILVKRKSTIGSL